MSKFKNIIITSCFILLSINLYHINAYAAPEICIDENIDGYCDVCGKTMDESKIVATGAIKSAHTHYGISGVTFSNGCYDEPYQVYEQNGEFLSEWYSSDCCSDCGQGPAAHYEGGPGCGSFNGHWSQWIATYGWVTHYKCTKTTIECGVANMIKTGNTLSLELNLDSTVDCVINSFIWKYNDTTISTSTTCEMTSIGVYSCTIEYTVTDSQGRVINAKTVLVYDAGISAFTNSAFYITKSATDTGYNLTLVQNADYTSYYDLISINWKKQTNAQTWDILPFDSSLETNNPLFVQNCGDYICECVIEGNDHIQHTESITYSLTSFDAKIAAKLAVNKKESFTYNLDYFSLQNIYNQAEKIVITDAQYNGTVLAKTPIMIFDSNHNLKTTESAEKTVKTYNGIEHSVSEIIQYDCNFTLSDYNPGTCTKYGTSTITMEIIASVYFMNSFNHDMYFSYSVPIHVISEKDISKNIKNHDCAIKSYEWKDLDGDCISDYLNIIRDCPASNGNWLITINLWPNDTDYNDDLFTIKHIEDIHSQEDSCETVNTIVTYEWLKNQYVNYEITEEAKHKYASVYIPVDCTHNGHRDYVCDHCGRKYFVITSEPLGHNYVWKITKPMTISEDGISTGTCSRCGNVTTKVISSLHTSLQNRTSFTTIPIFDPSIYEKPINTKDPLNRTQYYWDLVELYRVARASDEMERWNSGIGSYIGGNSFSAEARFSSLNELRPMELSITNYDQKESEKNTFIQTIENIIADILEAFRNIIDFFRDHPVIAVASILLLILIVTGIVLYILAKKDRIKFRKQNSASI